MYIFEGLSIFTGSIKDVVYRVGVWISQRKSSYVCVTGVHGFVEAQRSTLVMEAHKQSGLVVPDGMPLVWLGKIFGHKDTKRIYGPDLMLALCKEAEVCHWKIYLHGTTPNTLLLLERRLLNLFPKLKIVGRSSPPLRALSKNEESPYLYEINIANPDVLFVGLSTPKQELWMRSNVGKIHNTVLIGVGAAFDFIAGTKKQAPHWIQKTGFEWLFRLIQEPRRLGRRYLVNNSMFLYYLGRSLFRSGFIVIAFILFATLGVHGFGFLGALGVCGVLFFEFFYLGSFVQYIWKSPFRLIVSLFFAISTGIYGFFFQYINNLELWVDEIQVIRFGQLSLGSIAHEVMTKHVAVPPLDYWNMWVWNKAASLAPISITEFIYRLPYMAMHIITATLMAVVMYNTARKKYSLPNIWATSIGYFVYFINPLLFIYSYEVRYYALSFLGVATVAILSYKKKLFSLQYLPLNLLFCLASVNQFILLVPYVIFGLMNKVTRRNALVFGAAVLYMALMIVPYLYVPNPLTSILAPTMTTASLSWLWNFYFDSQWKVYCIASLVIMLILFRNKNAPLTMLVITFCLLAVVALDNKFNYQYFGAKHLLFILPLCTLVVIETLGVFQSNLYRVAISVLMVGIFIFPFYIRLQDIKTNKFFFAKSPLGLKLLMSMAIKEKMPIVVEYGNNSQKDVAYYQLAISWYTDLYKGTEVREFYNNDGCLVRNRILYSPIGTPQCMYKSNVKIVSYFDSSIVQGGN